jgi:thiol-disulfide isomerase/thioredoxin
MKIIKKIFFLLFLSPVLILAKKLPEGTYRAVLTLNFEKNIELPFNFDVKYKGKKPQIIIKNADERIIVNEITIKGDSVNFKMPVFDTEFRTKLIGNNLEGIWINHYKSFNNAIIFKAEFGNTQRFNFVPGKANPIFEGRWETTFSPTTKDSSKAIGVFHHNEQTDYLNGTFLTETGDYRYLEGMKNDNKMYLSCFDGSHAFLFIAEISEEKLNGIFYSGATWQEPFIAKQNENFKLANAESITFLKDKNAVLDFAFPDLNKKIVTLNDKSYLNKPIIIQLMGSWCPNCMDESKYLSSIYDEYKKQGLEIIALAFERTTDYDKAKSLLLRLKKRFSINYTILITQKTGKSQASETLSALNKVSAFPTTLFLNRKHEVVKIHTGFSGPATGPDFETFKLSTQSFIIQLLKE